MTILNTVKRRNAQFRLVKIGPELSEAFSFLGAIVGDRVVLNKLGQEVEAYWQNLPSKYPELELFDFVVMPNHFHALLRIHYARTNREHHLGFLVSRFKGGTAFIYGKMKCLHDLFPRKYRTSRSAENRVCCLAGLFRKRASSEAYLGG